MKIAALGLCLLFAVVSCDEPTNSTVTTPVPARTTPSATTIASTTEAPHTTPETPATTEPTPTPTPTPAVLPSDDSKFPDPVSFNVTIAGSNQTCLQAKLAVHFVVANGTKYLKLEKASRSDVVECKTENDTTISLKLAFGGNNVSFVFKRDDNLTSGWLDSIHLQYHVDNGTETANWDVTQKLFESNGTDALHGKRYTCKGEVATAVLNGVKAVFKEVEVQVGSSEHGSDLTSCPADEDINDMIPIAVGAALLALVAIVLVAYFVGRRRSRRLAYQSV